MKVTSVIVGGCSKDGPDLILGCVPMAEAEFFAVYLRYSDCSREHHLDFDTIQEAESDAKDLGEFYGAPVERCPYLMEASA